MITAVIDRKKYVLVPAAEYLKLVANAPPELPDADKDGNRPAIAFMEATIARSIVRNRKKVGLSQRELADRAGIRVEVLNRAERGVVVPSVRTLSKIENALKKAGLRR